MALFHAQVFPEEVQALVLVDPMNPRLVDKVGDCLKTMVPDVTEPASNPEYVLLRMTQTMDSPFCGAIRS